MKRTIMIIFLSFVVTFSAAAQGLQQKPEAKAADAKPSDSMPTVDQILDKYVQSIGGKAAIEKLTTRVMKGSLEIAGASQSLEIYKKAPNKWMMIINSPDNTFREIFDGAQGWRVDLRRGLLDISGDELIAIKRLHNLHREIKLKELYPKMVLKGREKVGDREAYVMEATPADGGAERMYFDTQTGMMVRNDLTFQLPQGKFTTEVYYEDYKELDGVKLPFTVRILNSNSPVQIVKFSEVKHNAPIDDAKFK